ncbi:SdpI family protein [Heyndrickxia sp. NPDC080065]|uniref:SdpI family protein n=1 Tax=Heyndrickxia sp. NPDC080065 TaxID=3390568 RepID=UPI003CFBF0F1
MKKHIFPIVIIGGTIIIWLFSLPYLSTEIPVHWGLKGEIDKYESKLTAMLSLTGIMVLTYFAITMLPKVDPKRENYKYFKRGYTFLVNFFLLLFFIMNGFAILGGLGYKLPSGSIGIILIGTIFIVIGNFLQIIRSNFFIGIRTPWTLSSDVVWTKTHRFAAKLLLISGFIIILTSLLPIKWTDYLVLGIVCFSVISTISYSYFIFKKEVQMIN